MYCKVEGRRGAGVSEMKSGALSLSLIDLLSAVRLHDSHNRQQETILQQSTTNRTSRVWASVCILFPFMRLKC